MNEERILSTIAELQTQVREAEQELAETKRTVNFLCRRIGRDPIYSITDSVSSFTATRSDEFYGKALATVVRTVLERRASANLGAASVDTIFAAMKAGGFMFNAKSDGTAKTALATSLAKNTTTFHKLPNGDFGLLEWYPTIPAKARGNGRQDEADEEESQPETPEPLEPDEDGLKEPYKNEFADAKPDIGTRYAEMAMEKEKEKKPRRQRSAANGQATPEAGTFPAHG